MFVGNNVNTIDSCPSNKGKQKIPTPSYSSRTWKMQGGTDSSWRARDGGVRIEEGISAARAVHCGGASCTWPAGDVSLAGVQWLE